jgi:small GTP-binding protein
MAANRSRLLATGYDRITSRMVAESYRIVVIGASGVGKTAILQSLMENAFDDQIQSTIGVEFQSWLCEVEGRRTKLHIWDTAGQERFRCVTRSYLRGALGALLVFDLSNRRSFDEVEGWLTEFKSLAAQNAVVLLVANKVDLVEGRTIPASEIQTLAEAHGLESIETSALTGANIKEAFLRIAAKIAERVQSGAIVVDNPTNASIITDQLEQRGCAC